MTAYISITTPAQNSAFSSDVGVLKDFKVWFSLVYVSLNREKIGINKKKDNTMSV